MKRTEKYTLRPVHKKKSLKNKKGVSEIISYIILVAITISVAVGVYAWLKFQIPSCGEDDIDCFLPVDCPDGTSLMISNYKCDNQGFNMTVVNNGRFNITGLIMVVAENSSKIPNEYITPMNSKTGRPGEFIFMNPLNPNKELEIRFSKRAKSNRDLARIELIKMQIFINESNRKICKNVIIRENIKNCIMS